MENTHTHTVYMYTAYHRHREREREIIGSLLPEPLECWCGIGADDSRQLCVPSHPLSASTIVQGFSSLRFFTP